jgi:hypothetical protein
MSMMLKARLLGAVGIVAVVGISGVLSAQAPTSPASSRTPLAFLPDNPCDLLTREQVAAATGLEVTAVQPQAQGYVPGGRTCSYVTASELGALSITVPSPMDRTEASYSQARNRAFKPPLSTTAPFSFPRRIAGVGEDAWLDDESRSLHVLTRNGETFILETQKYSQHSLADALVALARAVLDRLEEGA